MGCWNKTCAISHLPIFDQEDVMLVLLRNNTLHKSRSLCHNTGLWLPVGAPVFSKYNDYGGIEEPEPKKSRWAPWILDFLQKSVMPLEVGENKYHDIAVNAETLKDWKGVNEAIHENRLDIKVNANRGQWERGEVNQAMIKMSVVEELLKFPMQVYNYTTHRGEKVSFEKFYEGALDYFEYYNKLEGMDRYREYDPTLPRAKDWHLSRVFGDAGELYYCPIRVLMNLKELRNSEKFKASIFKEIVREVAMFAWVHMIMEMGRTIWTPQGGEGGQDTDSHCQVAMAKATIEIAKKDAKRWDDEESEDDF